MLLQNTFPENKFYNFRKSCFISHSDYLITNFEEILREPHPWNVGDSVERSSPGIA